MRKSLGLLAALATMLASTGCRDNDTTAALADLTASTVGEAVQILVQGALSDYLSQADPDLTVPISEQIH